jgi:hypothetical protein
MFGGVFPGKIQRIIVCLPFFKMIVHENLLFLAGENVDG